MVDGFEPLHFPVISPDVVYTQLQSVLKRDGTGQPLAPHRRELGISCELHTPQHGPVLVTDALGASAHRQATTDELSNPDLETLMESGNPIMLIIFGDTGVDSPTNLGVWYILAKPEDLRPGSLEHGIYVRAMQASGQPHINESQVQIFNDERVVTEPAIDPFLQDLSIGLQKVS